MVIIQVIVGGLLLGAIYALFSSGLTLIWGMMNFINFAHGEFVMLGMYVALLVVTWIGGARRCSVLPRLVLCSCSASASICR
jgi:branched-chain amino acid transport system permease protein